MRRRAGQLARTNDDGVRCWKFGNGSRKALRVRVCSPDAAQRVERCTASGTRKSVRVIPILCQTTRGSRHPRPRESRQHMGQSPARSGAGLVVRRRAPSWGTCRPRVAMVGDCLFKSVF